MPVCVVHPHIEQTLPCDGCALPFCEQCLADIMGQRLCEHCKLSAVHGMVQARKPHPLAVWSILVPAIGYMLCFFLPISGLAGLYLGSRVLAEIREQPHYSGRSAALLGMVIGGGHVATWAAAVAGMLVLRFAG